MAALEAALELGPSTIEQPLIASCASVAPRDNYAEKSVSFVPDNMAYLEFDPLPCHVISPGHDG